MIKSILLGCPSEKIVLKQREESNNSILHLLTIQYEIGKHIQEHEKLHKDASDITFPLFIAANQKLRKKKVELFFIQSSNSEFQQRDLYT